MSLGMNLGLGISLFKYGRLKGKGGSGGSISYPGLIAAWSAKGKTNDDEDRATLKDLTGNGHDITLKGFAFNESGSGYGGYTTKLSVWNKGGSGTFNIISPYKINILSCHIINKAILYTLNSNQSTMKDKKQKYKVQGLTDGQSVILGSDTGSISILTITTDGEYEVDWTKNNSCAPCIMCGFIGECNITIEVVPNYPDALVFDGVDDYGINENMPILTDYTIIVKRYRIEDKGCVIAKTGYPTSINSNNWDFILEGGSDYASSTWSLSVSNKKNIISEDITFQTKNSYNGETISYLSSYKGKANCLIIAKLYPNDSRLLRGAFYSAYLFNRSLDEQEIKFFIRKYIDPEYLLPSKIPTPDCYYDFSKGSNDDVNRNTIKDYSGNGNDAVAHNFAWSGMSGYGGNLYGNYKYHFDTLGKYQSIVSKTPVIGNLKFKVTGLTDYFNKTTNFIELRLIRVSDGGTDYKEIKEDGEYNIELPTSKYSEISIRSGGINIEDDACNIDIEMLPEYPGALIFDGVDDYISLDAFDSGFKTMFMVCNPRNKSNAFLYDQRKNTKPPYDYGLYTYKSVAYNMRNANGTYINGIKNTKVFTKDLNNKKILISVNSELTQLNKPTISTGITGSYSDMALYKFLGFKEALTEEQIQAVIKKYNLLDGVDEIEVS